MIAEVKKSAEQKMVKSVEALKANLAKVRTGRAHPGILDHIQVDYYGSPTPLTQVANITLIDARTIGVTPWEKKMARKSKEMTRSFSNVATYASLVASHIRCRSCITTYSHTGALPQFVRFA